MIRPRKFRTRQARTRERVRVTVRITLSIIGITGVLALAGWGLTWDKLRITTVVVETDGALRHEDVSAVITKAFEGHNALFVPNDTILFSGMHAVENALTQAFPRIQTVDLERAGMRALTASIQERTPNALWCGDIVPEIAYASSKEQKEASDEAWGDCYLMDADSFLYAEAPIFTGDVFMRYYGSLVIASPIGQNFIPQEEFKAWQTFVADIAKEGLIARALLIVDERDCELYLNNGLRILMPRTEDLAVLENRLYATVSDEAIDMARDIEYVDLRFGTKAFIKYKAIEAEIESVSGEEE